MAYYILNGNGLERSIQGEKSVPCECPYSPKQFYCGAWCPKFEFIPKKSGGNEASIILHCGSPNRISLWSIKGQY